MKKDGFLLVELLVAFGIMVAILSAVARFQRVSWQLLMESERRMVLLDKKIDRCERTMGPLGAGQ